MTPADFALWMKGVVDALGNEPPSPERWARIVDQVQKIGPAPVQIKLSEYVPTTYPAFPGGGTARAPWDLPYTLTCGQEAS